MEISETNDIELIPVFERLYQVLERDNIPTSKDNKLKSHVLKVIYKFVEMSDETLLLHITRIALMVRILFDFCNFRIVFNLGIWFLLNKCVKEVKLIAEKRD